MYVCMYVSLFSLSYTHSQHPKAFYLWDTSGMSLLWSMLDREGGLAIANNVFATTNPLVCLTPTPRKCIYTHAWIVTLPNTCHISTTR